MIRHFDADNTASRGYLAKVFMRSKQLENICEAYVLGPIVIARQVQRELPGQDVFNQMGFVTKWIFGFGRVDLMRIDD